MANMGERTEVKTTNGQQLIYNTIKDLRSLLFTEGNSRYTGLKIEISKRF